MHSQQSLVGRDHMLARIDRSQHQLLGNGVTTDQFNHHVDIVALDCLECITQHLNAGTSQFARFFRVQVGDDFDLNGKTHTAFNFTRIGVQHIECARTDSTQTQQGHSKRFVHF